MSNDENKELSKLININEDAAEFYESAQEKAESPELKLTFGNLESLHKSVIVNLQSIVRTNGGDPEADETLVTHLEEAEDRCINSIKEAMQSEDISLTTKAALQDEVSILQKSHDHVKALKDYMKAA